MTKPLEVGEMARKSTEAQLRLIEDEDWALDARTREIGRQGVEAARRLLRNTSGPSAPQPTRQPHAA